MIHNYENRSGPTSREGVNFRFQEWADRKVGGQVFRNCQAKKWIQAMPLYYNLFNLPDPIL